MSAKSIFDDVIKREWEAIKEWTDDHVPETLHLDFKEKDHKNASEYMTTDGDESNIAKAMSGFANSDGGVLVFGITRQKTPKSEPDRAGSVAHIPDVQRCAARLDNLGATLTDPPIAGLQFKALIDPNRSGDGVVVVYVPASDAPPHRADKGDNATLGRYFFRTGTCTVPMTHGQLAEKFGRRPLPRLVVLATYTGDSHNAFVRLSLRNDGRGSGVQPAIEFRSMPPVLITDSEWRIMKNYGPRADGAAVYQSMADVVVYPGMTLAIGGVRPGYDTKGITPDEYTLHVRVYCRDAAPSRFSGTVRRDCGEVTLSAVGDPAGEAPSLP